MASQVSIITAVDLSVRGLGPVFPRGLTPIDVDSLSVTLPLRGQKRNEYPVPEIAFDELSRISFPAFVAPLAFPRAPNASLSPAAKALLEPTLGPAPWDVPIPTPVIARAPVVAPVVMPARIPGAPQPLACAPIASKPKKRRRWPKLFFAAVLGAVTGWGVFQTPLARDPHVRPYAEAVNAKTKQAWTATRVGVARGVAWTSAEYHAYVK